MLSCPESLKPINYNLTKQVCLLFRNCFLILPSSAQPSQAATGGSQISWAEISFIITAQPPTHPPVQTPTRPPTHPPNRPPTHPPGIVVLKQEIVQIQNTLINNISHTTQIK